MKNIMTHSAKVSPLSHIVSESLLSINSIKFNVESPFTWVSGIKSPIYCDNRKVNSYVDIRKKIVDAFVDFIQRELSEVEVIAGVATGGIPMGILIADKMNLPFIYVRQAPKEHGLMRQVEGDYNENDKVVLIEDHVSTGGSSLKAINGLRKEGLNLLGLVSIMTYGFKTALDRFEENNVNHLTLCDLDSILDTAYNLKMITSEQKNSILNFRKNPKNWK